MAYFNEFPYIYYEALKNDPKITKDILRRVAYRMDIRDQTRLFLDYHVTDTDTPETIADRLYDDPALHWIVLFMNDMFNRWEDWPLSQDRLRSFVTAKYGSGNEQETNHYELIDGTHTNGPIFMEDSDDFNIQDSSGEFISVQDISTNIGQPLPISNAEHEDRLNEGKRRIRLLRSDYVPAVVEEFQSKIA